MCTISLQGIRPLLLVLCALTVCLQPVEAPGEGGPPPLSLSPVWTTGIVSDGVGLSHIIVTDLQRDGIPDIVAGSAYAAYVLNPAPGGGYETIWYSEATRADWTSSTGNKIAVGDRDGDGLQEIFVATDTATVRVYGGSDLHKIATLNLPGDMSANDIGVADVDRDGICELVAVRNDSVLVYNANRMTLKWEVTGKGGTGLGIGNIDGDSSMEIVVNGNPAHIFNAETRTEEWGRTGGFGTRMALGDVDGDRLEEIIFIDQGVRVFDADTRTTKWVREIWTDAIAVSDVDGDGTSEVLSGDNQWGSVRGLKGTDGTELWAVPNPEHGVSDIAAGDVDKDGASEIVWGAGLTSSGKDVLLIGNWISQSVEWESEDLDGPLCVTSGDIDRDGQVEIVMTSFESGSGYNGGTIHVYDGRTHALEWQTTIADSFWQINYVAVGQLDADPALEIVLAGNHWYNTRIRVYDGISHATEWESPVFASGGPAAFLVRNVDQDSLDEIIVGLNDGQHVLVFDGATEIFQWDSGVLGGQIQDLDVGDLDGDSLVDLVVLTDSNVYVFKGDNWIRNVQKPLEGGKRISIANADLKGAGELLITTGDSETDTKLQMWDGKTLQPKWLVSLGLVSVADIVTGNLDGGTDEEFVLIGAGTQTYYQGGLSLLKICSQTTSSFQVKYDNTDYWGAINSLSLGDVDQDGQYEAMFGSAFLIQVNEVTVVPGVSLDLTLGAGGAASSVTVGEGEVVQAGYAVLTVNSGTTPYGTAVFSFKQNGVTVSEAGVPASPPTTSGRIFIDYRSAVPAVPSRSDAGTVDINTGIAVVNRGSGTANVTYLLRSVLGATLSSGHGTIAAGAHFAKFIDQMKDVASDFSLPLDFQGTIQFGSLEISSDQPLSILALRMTTNQRNEVLFTTTPTVDLTQSLSNTRMYFPQFADGGGYTTALVLLNTSNEIETGTFQILDDLGAPLVVNQVGGTADSSFNYSITSGGAFRFQTDGFPATTKVGWIRLTPDAGTSTPVGAGVFGYNPGNVLVTESGIPAAASTTHARVYVDLSGGHNTGLAIANLEEINASISIKAYQSDGATGIGISQGPLPLPANGHSAKFAGEFVAGLPAEFTGVLDIRSATPFTALTMRSLTNERADFLLTTFPIADANGAAPSPIVFPQIADGGGYVTQFILLSPGGASSTTLNFYGETGAPLAVGKW